ncbi:Proteasome subunit alpha type-3 [Pseudolycoriella hygida]|uniref:Proteasome subunit alpha type n=1 Tax=Pseudolycoriella hygida TaxID=35572 RepID=A0A9Q0MR24_9DIPT|nr:Proteasome subunit alpha type-3 [Pseudolycoriella hygida]
MSSIGTGYDLSASQFSPDGRVFQIDYAGKAVEQSGTLIGLRGKNGVVLAVEKIVRSPLYEEDSGSRIYSVDKHIGIAIAGLLADGRQIVETARKEALNYKQQFDRPIPIKVLNDRISSFIHAYTLYSAVRPFGVSVILASYSPETGPQMYMIEPSGSSYGYSGCATGKAKQAAKTEIEKLKLADMDIEELITQAGKIIYQVHDELKDKLFKMELSWVCELSDGLHQIVPDEWYKKAYTAGVESKRDDDSDNDI